MDGRRAPWRRPSASQLVHLQLLAFFFFNQALGRKARSLASLTLAYCSTELDKSYQAADWRRRPLPDDYVAYARADVRYLLYLCGVLRWVIVDFVLTDVRYLCLCGVLRWVVFGFQLTNARYLLCLCGVLACVVFGFAYPDVQCLLCLCGVLQWEWFAVHEQVLLCLCGVLRLGDVALVQLA